MKYKLGIDLGTSYFKAGLFGSGGELAGLGRVEVRKQVGDGTRCELDVDDFWHLLQQAIGQAKSQAGAATGEIVSMGYSSQANTFLLLDKHDEPLTPLIVWMDRRAKDIYPEVRDLWRRKGFLHTSGLGTECSEHLCINKLLWFQAEEPQVWQRTSKILTICDYLVYSLTKRQAVDTGTSSLLGILDINALAWNTDALCALNIGPDKLSAPSLPGTPAGVVSQETPAAQLGLPTGIPVYLGSLDHYMAAVGAGLGRTGQATISLGTVVACVNQAPDLAPQKDICITPAVKGRGYHQLAWDQNGGAVLEWYNRTFCPDMTPSDLDEAAAIVPADCAGLCARPNANKYEGLKGFENINEHHTHGHFARAIMLSVAQTITKLLDSLCRGRPRPRKIIATGGAAKSAIWLKICSDTTNADVSAADCHEPACKGAASICPQARRGKTPGHSLSL